jgi:VanZ family protein
MIRWLALALWYAAIVFTSSLASAPTTDQPFVDYLINKGGHVFVYAMLGWLLSEALTAREAGLGLDRRAALATTILAGALLASLDETRQSFVYGRTAMVSDAILDTIALSGGTLLHQWLRFGWSGSPLTQPRGDARQQSAVEDQHQELHREDLPVAVDVRQESHHDPEVDQHEEVQRQGTERPRGR